MTQEKEFLQSIDMFDQSPKVVLKGELLLQLKEWRKQKMYCQEHQPDE